MQPRSPHPGALPPVTARLLAVPRRDGLRHAAARAMAQKWSMLHQAAYAVAELAGVSLAKEAAEVHDFPNRVANAGSWRHAMADQGIEDLVAILKPGLSALLTIHARGADTAAPARVLWEEFQQSRNALLRLIPESEDIPPRPRS